jgi:hypothetical protein
MQQNDGAYTLSWQSLAHRYESDPDYADGVLVLVTFADGQRAEFVWYRRNVQVCRYGPQVQASRRVSMTPSPLPLTTGAEWLCILPR